ncbi:membrane protein [Mycobacterium phage Ringer]|nr:membrane protein [Mycobacterium phage Ringer]
MTITKRIATGFFLLIAPAVITTPAWASADPISFDQSSFPCEEDEVLGFSPEFGPDKVGCIHIDSLR